MAARRLRGWTTGTLVAGAMALAAPGADAAAYDWTYGVAGLQGTITGGRQREARRIRRDARPRAVRRQRHDRAVPQPGRPRLDARRAPARPLGPELAGRARPRALRLERAGQHGRLRHQAPLPGPHREGRAAPPRARRAHGAPGRAHPHPLGDPAAAAGQGRLRGRRHAADGDRARTSTRRRRSTTARSACGSRAPTAASTRCPGGAPATWSSAGTSRCASSASAEPGAQTSRTARKPTLPDEESGVSALRAATR